MRTGVEAFAACLLLSVTCLFGQHLSYGIMAGTALTDDFNSYYYPPVDGYPLDFGKSGGKGLILGPTLEWKFGQQFSVEGDGLYRELRFENSGGTHNPTVTWEFPILAKFSVPVAAGGLRLRPFVEAGPSFRTTGNLNANPSHLGISAGGGLNVRFGNFGVAPTLRYTRWREDTHPFGISSRPDQLELLVDFSYSPQTDRRPFTDRLSLGAVLGLNLLGDYNPMETRITNDTTGTPVTFSSRPGARSFLVGPAFEVRLGGGFAVEGDAVYRPVRDHYTNTLVLMGEPFTVSGNGAFTSWQFPVLAKYYMPGSIGRDGVKPFVEAGPSFRIGGSLTHLGFTAGGGVSTHLGRIHIGPALRYTRWRETEFSNVKSNDLSLLVGVSF